MNPVGKLSIGRDCRRSIIRNEQDDNGRSHRWHRPCRPRDVHDGHDGVQPLVHHRCHRLRRVVPSSARQQAFLRRGVPRSARREPGPPSKREDEDGVGQKGSSPPRRDDLVGDDRGHGQIAPEFDREELQRQRRLRQKKDDPLHREFSQSAVYITENLDPNVANPFVARHRRSKVRFRHAPPKVTQPTRVPHPSIDANHLPRGGGIESHLQQGVRHRSTLPGRQTRGISQRVHQGEPDDPEERVRRRWPDLATILHIARRSYRLSEQRQPPGRTVDHLGHRLQVRAVPHGQNAVPFPGRSRERSTGPVGEPQDTADRPTAQSTESKDTELPP